MQIGGVAAAVHLGSELDNPSSMILTTHQEQTLTSYTASKVRRGIQKSSQYMEYRRPEFVFYLLVLVTAIVKIITTSAAFSLMVGIYDSNIIASQVSIVSIPFGFTFKEVSKFLAHKTLNLDNNTVIQAAFYRKDDYVFAASRMKLLVPIVPSTFKNREFDVMKGSSLSSLTQVITTRQPLLST